jgi:hypothetical protein
MAYIPAGNTANFMGIQQNIEEQYKNELLKKQIEKQAEQAKIGQILQGAQLAASLGMGIGGMVQAGKLAEAEQAFMSGENALNRATQVSEGAAQRDLMSQLSADEAANALDLEILRQGSLDARQESGFEHASTMFDKGAAHDVDMFGKRAAHDKTMFGRNASLQEKLVRLREEMNQAGLQFADNLPTAVANRDLIGAQTQGIEANTDTVTKLLPGKLLNQDITNNAAQAALEFTKRMNPIQYLAGLAGLNTQAAQTKLMEAQAARNNAEAGAVEAGPDPEQLGIQDIVSLTSSGYDPNVIGAVAKSSGTPEAQEFYGNLNRTSLLEEIKPILQSGSQGDITKQLPEMLMETGDPELAYLAEQLKYTGTSPMQRLDHRLTGEDTIKRIRESGRPGPVIQTDDKLKLQKKILEALEFYLATGKLPGDE